MRKLILLAAMLAMVLLVAVPAFAQEQEAESGDVIQTYDVSNSGDNSNQCVGIQGVANTGNVQNAVEVDFAAADGVDDDLDGLIDELGEDFFDDVSVEELIDLIEAFNAANEDAAVEDLSLDIGGASLDVSPTNVTDCNQSVNQEAYALSY